MTKEVLTKLKEKMKKAEGALSRELGTIRAGRANASLLDKLVVDYYGAPTPVNQLASITTPEARMLLITPFDKTILPEIEKAILKSDLGLTPNNDGSLLRLKVPQLTEERRKELAKKVKKEAEEAKVVARNLRREANEELKKLEKTGKITEDDLYSYESDVQKLTDESINHIDVIAKNKEAEILEI